ncbi:hypothetical protein MPH_09123 [Macrophomina phaseolina MS6]|uniref:Uncharacterized protein n=1 Tax=Macrophomina phaseolina (strain MS6) TaxID=1126212 RepID=K2RGC5_MACPH|nr:hypothetical protein MPH_09123 [Macrophomina phaseolina MS6]
MQFLSTDQVCCSQWPAYHANATRACRRVHRGEMVVGMKASGRQEGCIQSVLAWTTWLYLEEIQYWNISETESYSVTVCPLLFVPTRSLSISGQARNTPGVVLSSQVLSGASERGMIRSTICLTEFLSRRDDRRLARK